MSRFGEPFDVVEVGLVHAFARLLYELDPMTDSADDLDGRTIHAGDVPWRSLPEYHDLGDKIIAQHVEDAELFLAKLHALGIRTVLPNHVTLPLNAAEARAMILAGEHFLKNAPDTPPNTSSDGGGDAN